MKLALEKQGDHHVDQIYRGVQDGKGSGGGASSRSPHKQVNAMTRQREDDKNYSRLHTNIGKTLVVINIVVCRHCE